MISKMHLIWWLSQRTNALKLKGSSRNLSQSGECWRRNLKYWRMKKIKLWILNVMKLRICLFLKNHGSLKEAWMPPITLLKRMLIRQKLLNSNQNNFKMLEIYWKTFRLNVIKVKAISKHLKLRIKTKSNPNSKKSPVSKKITKMQSLIKMTLR